MAVVDQEAMHFGQRLHVTGPVQLRTQGSHAQMSDAGLDARLQNAESFRLAAVLDPDSALGSDVSGIPPSGTRKVVDLGAKVGELLRLADREPAVCEFADAAQDGFRGY